MESYCIEKLWNFFSNTLGGMRINTNKKPHECGAFFKKNKGVN
tara:strand:- start:162 stop:290 length:129 start_codon:yes stop_codon:yes gene_type:complete